MEALNRAVRTATLQIEEVQATARIWHSYSEIIVSKSSLLYPVFSNEPEKTLYKKAMQDKGTDASALYRGLTIQLNGIFESYIRSLVGVILDSKCKSAKSYNELEETIKIEHIVSSAKVLSHLKSGSVNGIKHDFEMTQKNLGKCLTDSKDFSLNKEAFTLLMGNCTPERIETLFNTLGLPKPFEDNLGENKLLQAWANDKTKRRVSKAAREYLEKYIDTRNDIVHGNINKALTPQDFIEAAQFFEALITALSEIANSGLIEKN